MIYGDLKMNPTWFWISEGVWKILSYHIQEPRRGWLDGPSYICCPYIPEFIIKRGDID